jgi:hypothetical protein
LADLFLGAASNTFYLWDLEKNDAPRSSRLIPQEMPFSPRADLVAIITGDLIGILSLRDFFLPEIP